MANDNSISEETLMVNSSNLTEECNKWTQNVSSVGLSSIDVSGTFSALTDLGIGTSYFTSLKTALERADKLATNISKLIDMSATDQEEVDDKSASDASSNSYGNATYDRSNSNNSSSGGSAVASVSESDTGSYTADNTDSNTSIKSENETLESTLDDIEEAELVAAFQSIVDESSILEITDLEDYTHIKDLLLESPYLTDDLKEKISSMDENEIITTLSNILVSGELLSDFSKSLITTFDTELKNNYEKATIYDSADSISKVYEYLQKESNFQDQIKEIYFGVSEIEQVDENVITLTRSFVDLLATANNVTYEEILNDPKFQTALLEGMEDINESFHVLSVANEISNDKTSELYSNIIVGDES